MTVRRVSGRIRYYKEVRVMYFINSYFTVAMVLAVVVAIAIVALHWQETAARNRRIFRMMLSCGIDEETARKADRCLELDMDEVRARCRKCPVPDLCKRWLGGEAVPSNDFCPNVWHFNAALETGQSQQSHDPRHRPGRRLDI
ncbi:MAG: hypothetical protein KAJ57_07365 [Woeseiaceae bacterium]|nr:hypothetical protein [Woeseiaceae bacterium]